MYERCRVLALGNECFLLDDGGALSEYQPPRWIHAFYDGMFSSGLIPMGYVLYISLGLVQFLSLICGGSG